MHGKICFLLSTIAFAATTHGQLKWQQKEIELSPSIADTSAVAHFKYENVGKTSVRFLSVQSSCGCTAAASTKNDVAPGEKGEITATFTIGDRIGLQNKAIRVTTNEASDPITTLMLKVNIPQLLSVTPTLVFWNYGQLPTPKSIDVKVGKDFSVDALKVVPSIPEFTAKVEKGSDPKMFHIIVQPKDTSHPLSAILTIQPHASPTPPKPYNVIVRVLNPPASLPPSPAITPNIAPSPPPSASVSGV
jgi:Protein of unknown function (DUF1573)